MLCNRGKVWLRETILVVSNGAAKMSSGTSHSPHNDTTIDALIHTAFLQFRLQVSTYVDNTDNAPHPHPHPTQSRGPTLIHATLDTELGLDLSAYFWPFCRLRCSGTPGASIGTLPVRKSSKLGPLNSCSFWSSDRVDLHRVEVNPSKANDRTP